MGNSTRPRFKLLTVAAAVVAVVALATACSQAPPPKPKPHPAAAPVSTPATAPPVGPHGGVNLNVLVVTDGTRGGRGHPPAADHRGPAVHGHRPARLLPVGHHPGRSWRAQLPDGTKGGNFDGIVLPSAAPQALSAAEEANLAWYERKFGVRQVDAYAPPDAQPGHELAAGLQRAAHRGRGRDPGRSPGRVRLPQRVVPVQRGAGRPRAVRLPGPAAARRRGHAAGDREDPALVRLRHARVAVRQRRAPAARDRLRLQLRPGAVPLPGARHRGLAHPRGEPRRLAQLPRHRLRRHVPRGLSVEHGRALHARRHYLPQGHADDGDDPDEAGRRDVRRAVGAAAPLHDRVPVQRRGVGPVRGAWGRRAAGRHPAGGQGLLLGQPHLDPRVLRLPAELQAWCPGSACGRTGTSCGRPAAA